MPCPLDLTPAKRRNGCGGIDHRDLHPANCPESHLCGQIFGHQARLSDRVVIDQEQSLLCWLDGKQLHRGKNTRPRWQVRQIRQNSAIIELQARHLFRDRICRLREKDVGHRRRVEERPRQKWLRAGIVYATIVQDFEGVTVDGQKDDGSGGGGILEVDENLDVDHFPDSYDERPRLGFSLGQTDSLSLR